MSVKAPEVSAEEVARRLAEYRHLGLERGLPAQVIYQDPHILCPWPGCDLRINAIQFHLESWPDQERRLLKAWWDGPGLVGRCPSCGRYVLYGQTSKEIPPDWNPAILPDDWIERAHIVSNPDRV